jgi:hypothetical protein
VLLSQCSATGVPPQGFRCAANFYKKLHIRTFCYKMAIYFLIIRNRITHTHTHWFFIDSFIQHVQCFVFICLHSYRASIEDDGSLFLRNADSHPRQHCVTTQKTTMDIFTDVRTQILSDSVRFEVLTAVSTKMAVFWVVAPCSLVEVYQRFRRPCCLHHQGDESSLQPRRRPYSLSDLFYYAYGR